MHKRRKYSDVGSVEEGTWALIEPFVLSPTERARRLSFQDTPNIKASIAFNTVTGLAGMVDNKHVRVQILPNGYQVTHCDCQVTVDPSTGLAPPLVLCAHAHALICAPLSPTDEIISQIGNVVHSALFVRICEALIQSLIFEKSQILSQATTIADLFHQFADSQTLANFPVALNMDKILAACSTQYRLSIAESQINSVVVIDSDLTQLPYLSNGQETPFKYDSTEWERFHNEGALVWIVSNTNTGDKCVIGYNVDPQINFPQVTYCSGCHLSIAPLANVDKTAGAAALNPVPGSLCEHVCAALSTLKKYTQKEWPDSAPTHASVWNYNAFRRFLNSKETDHLLLHCLIDFLTLEAQNTDLFMHSFHYNSFCDLILKAIKDASGKSIDTTPPNDAIAPSAQHQQLTQSQSLITALFGNVKTDPSHNQSNGSMSGVAGTSQHMSMHDPSQHNQQASAHQSPSLVSPQGRPVRNRKRRRYDESEDDEDDDMDEEHTPKRQRGGRKGSTGGVGRGRPRKGYEEGHLHTPPLTQSPMPHYNSGPMGQEQMYTPSGGSMHQDHNGMPPPASGMPQPILYNNGEPMRLRMFREFVAPEFVQLVLNQNMNDHDIIQHFHHKFPEAKKFVTGHSIWCVRNGVTYTKLSGIAKNKNTKKRQKTANGKQAAVAAPSQGAEPEDEDEDEEPDEGDHRPVSRSGSATRVPSVQHDNHSHSHHPSPMPVHSSHASRPPSTASPPTSPFNMPTFDNLHPLPNAYGNVPFPGPPPIPTGVTNAPSSLDPHHHHHHQMVHHNIHHFSPYMGQPPGRLEGSSDLTSSQGAAVAAINALRTALPGHP